MFDTSDLPKKEKAIIHKVNIHLRKMKSLTGRYPDQLALFQEDYDALVKALERRKRKLAPWDGVELVRGPSRASVRPGGRR